jgi:hypothetical protein
MGVAFPDDTPQRRPVQDPQTRYALELAGVIGREQRARHWRVAGDHHVVRTNRCPGAVRLSSELAESHRGNVQTWLPALSDSFLPQFARSKGQCS